MPSLPPLRALVPCLALGLAACGPSAPTDPGLEGLDVQAVNPGVLVPGSTLVIEGRSFVGEPWGESQLRLRGTFEDGEGAREVEVLAPTEFVDFDELHVRVDDALLAQLGADEGEFRGLAGVLIDSAVDGDRHTSPELEVHLSFRAALEPRLESIAEPGLIFVNDWIEIEGDGLLLGGDEGLTVARVSGCFRPAETQACADISPVEVTLDPIERFDRQHGRFAFVPQIAGISPGTFEGSVSLRNVHGTGIATESRSVDVSYELTEPTIFTIGPESASLGQYIEVHGGGFLSGAGTDGTVLQLTGEFVPERGPPVALDVVLVPEFAEGRLVRYLVNEDDSLGEEIDMRYGEGTIAGEIVPVTRYAGVEVVGDSVPFSVDLAPVKQVVYLRFTPQYVAALRSYGLRALDAEIRDRIRRVVERDFATVNLEVRMERPEDFALFSEVEIGGEDPNGRGLLGYDNTPGKDVGNLRLHDRIGGVNATTQEDGYPGFGGVFIESMFVFSEHPADFAPASAVADPLFDDVFDPFRPDRGGSPVRAADLQGGGFDELDTGDECPATDRPTQMACAVFVLGNLIGGTVSHEIGHSLGLANPQGSQHHYLTDAPDRIMDAGSNRPFIERAELSGAGPARFCESAYQYLRVILPTDFADDPAPRPSCE